MQHTLYFCVIVHKCGCVSGSRLSGLKSYYTFHKYNWHSNPLSWVTSNFKMLPSRCWTKAAVHTSPLNTLCLLLWMCICASASHSDRIWCRTSHTWRGTIDWCAIAGVKQKTMTLIEFSIALFALEWPFASMCSHMLLDGKRLDEMGYRASRNFQFWT